MVFAVAAGVPVYLALRGGGYDLIVRHELGLVLWAALALGFAFGVFPRGRLSRLDSLPLAFAAGLALVTLLSLTWTGSDERTFEELARVVTLAGVVALPLYSLNRHTWRAAAGGLASAAVTVVALAVASRIAPGAFPTDEVATAFGGNRLSYPLDYWNGVAAWSAIAATMALAYSAHLERTWLRCATLAAVPVAVACVYLTYSRAGAIGLAMGVLAVLALSRNRWTALAHALGAAACAGVVILIVRDHPAIVAGTGGQGGPAVAAALAAAAFVCAAIALGSSSVGLDRVRVPAGAPRRRAATALVVVVVVGLIAGAGAISQAWDEFRNQRTVLESSEDPARRLTTAGGTRADIWDSGLDAFSSRPVGGIGPGTFEFWWNERAPVPEYLRDAHSLYVEQLAELGLPGLALLLGFVGGGLALAIRNRIGLRRPSELAAAVAMCAGAIVFCVHAGVDWMWELTAVSALGLAAIGVVLPARCEATRRLAPRWRVVGVSVAVAALLTQIPGLASTARVREAAGALGDDRVAEARQLDGDAIAAQPWAATPYASRAAAEARAGDLQAALIDLDSAIDREPDNWRLWLALAQVQVADDDQAGARESFDRLRALSLSSAVPYDTARILALDPATKTATRRGCLGYLFGACDYAGEGMALECLPGEESAAAIRTGRGAVVKRIRAVATADRGGYYVAGEVDGAITTWGLDARAYLTGAGTVVPLDSAARAASTVGPPVDPETFGISPFDTEARAARSCQRP